MPLKTDHPSVDLLRYLDGALDAHERPALEQHLATCSECSAYLAFVQDFNGALAELPEGAFRPTEPCPDASTLVAYEAGEVDEGTAQVLRVHLLGCDICTEQFYALRRSRPQIIDVILRKVGAIIECLKAPEGVAWRPLPVAAVVRARGEVLAAPFRIRQTVADPDTTEHSTVTLLVEAALGEDAESGERVSVVLESNLSEEWRVSLFEADRTKRGAMPLGKSSVPVHPELEYGFYTVEISKGAKCLCEFSFSVEPFSLPEAKDTARRYLEGRDYGRSLAILEDAIRRHSDDQELEGLRALVLAAAYYDSDEVSPEPGEEDEDLEEAEEDALVVTERRRGVRDFLRKRLQNLRRKLKFGDGFGSLLAASALDPSLLTEEVLSRIRAQNPSLLVLQASVVLQKHLKVAEERTKELGSLFGDFRSRLEQFSTLLEALRNSVGAIQRDTSMGVDEKFTALGTTFERFTEDVPRQGLTLPENEVFFRDALGEGCWSWMGLEVQKIGTSAEALYRYLGTQPAAYMPDFTPALLQLCRGFEMLVNNKLGGICREIATVLRNPEPLNLLKRTLPKMFFDVGLLERTISLTRAANLLVAGRVLQRERPGTFTQTLEKALANSPELTDVTVLVPLMYIGVFLRNGKVHPEAGSPSLFTTAEEMQISRKLIWGLDEYRVLSRELLYRLTTARWWWFSEPERQEADTKLRSAWGVYPGLVKMLWQATGGQAN